MVEGGVRRFGCSIVEAPWYRPRVGERWEGRVSWTAILRA
jgi:hypothetical protein